MEARDIYEKIDYGQVEADQLAELIVADAKLLPASVDGLREDNPQVRATCAKALRIISSAKPGLIYPWFNSLIGLLNSTRFFVKIDLIYILANLAQVDSQNKLENYLDDYFGPLQGRNLLVARAVIRAAVRIVAAKPKLADRIAAELLRVEYGKFENEENRRVIYEAALETIEQINSMVLQQAA